MLTLFDMNSILTFLFKNNLNLHEKLNYEKSKQLKKERELSFFQ